MIISSCHNNESQFKEIVNAYIRQGIDRNQINVLLIYTKEQQKFIESIDSQNIKFPAQLARYNDNPSDEGFMMKALLYKS